MQRAQRRTLRVVAARGGAAAGPHPCGCARAAALLPPPPPPLTPLMLTAPALAAPPPDPSPDPGPGPAAAPALPTQLASAQGLGGTSPGALRGGDPNPRGGGAGPAGVEVEDLEGEGSVRRSLRAETCGLPSTRRRRNRK